MMDLSSVENSRLTENDEVNSRDSKQSENKADSDDDCCGVSVNTHTDTNGASSPAADNDPPITAVTVANDGALTTTPDLGKLNDTGSLKEKERFIESFFSNAPVFPARSDGELGDMSVNKNTAIKTAGNSSKSDENIAKDPILFQYDVGAMKYESSLQKEVSSSIQDTIKMENYSNSENNLENKETDTPSENDVPLPLNPFFLTSGQYQTPSWIDDPLIGVPPSAMENKNTHRKTGADMRILTAYMRSLNEMRLPEAIPPNELDKYLSSFFLVVRKADGSEYEPCSLRAMLASIERYLRFKNYPLSLTRDSAFSNMRNVLKLKQQTLRSIGKGQKGPSEVTPSTLAKEGKIAHLFKSQEMGPYTPSSVVFTLCFYFCMYLRLRKSTENKKLLWGDVVLCKDDSGREFLTFSSQMLRQSQGSSKLNLKQRSYRVWADPSCPEKDPVTIYKFYAQKRPISMNTNMAPFYLGINVLYPTQGQPWYRPAAMGINKLNEMVRQIRDMTGIRSTSDFHGDMQISDKGSEGDAGSTQSEHSPLSETTERQELDVDLNLKQEIREDVENEDDDSELIMDFSQDNNNKEINLNNSNSNQFYSSKLPVGSSLPQGMDSGFSQATSCSDGDSNDSFPSQSFTSGGTTIGHAGANTNVVMNGNTNQELDLSKADHPIDDSPLNCSIRSRDSQNDLVNGVCNPLHAPDFLSLSEAKEQLIRIVQRMEASDVIQMDGWLKKISFCPDPFSGKIVCKDLKEAVQVNARSISVSNGKNGNNGTNITLNISLSPESLQPGGGPITITTQTLTEPRQDEASSFHHPDSPECNNIKNGGNGSQFPSSKHSSSSSPIPKTNNLMTSSSSRRNSSPSSNTTTPIENSSMTDKPLDLATSPLHRHNNNNNNNKFMPHHHHQQQQSSQLSQHTQQISNSNPANLLLTDSNNPATNNRNGVGVGGFPACLFDQPLAKRLRLSAAEQADAYASASLMAASLSSTNLVNERLRLQLMQAASLNMADVAGGGGGGVGDNGGGGGVHGHSLLDFASASEALRSQFLQHYGIKAEPK